MDMQIKQQNWELIGDYKVPFFSSDSRNIVSSNEKIIKYSNGEIFHKFNKLNELTSKQWLKFQKSWFVLTPKPREKNVLLHPAKFPEELVKQFVEFFTKKGETVLDPMVGTGSTLVACAESGRNGIGIELLDKYAKIADTRVRKIANQNILESNHSLINIKIIRGDARDMNKMHLGKVDYCITSPPYWDMLTESGFETQENRKIKGLDTKYSDNEDDVGNIHDYNKFLDELVNIYKNVFEVLKVGGYFTVVVKNVKKGKQLYPLAWDIGKRLGEFFELKDEKIWCQSDISLAPYGYGHSWVSNTVHHYCLNFKKD
ncbi:MAG: DNA methyltransferase [Caldisphaera sp.]